jgi:hypothetical protein
MQPRVYDQHIWLRWLVLVGVAAVAFTFFAIFSVEWSRSTAVSLRHHETWRSNETMPVSFSGIALSGNRSLVGFYAQLAAGPTVRKVGLRDGSLKGRYEVKTIPENRLSTCSPSSFHQLQ